ncbi:MAG: tetratricopeptide (TPR) repeat protein [Candidatus Pelagisphaera sp.]|jgi:tetratricopeptide (TPR) repeat protein
MNANRKRTLTISAAALFVIGCIIAFNLFNQRPNKLAHLLSLPPLEKIENEDLQKRIESAYISATYGFQSIGSLDELSKLYHANGYLSEARECYDVLIQNGDGNPKHSHRLARILSSYGLQDKAITLYRSVTQQDPDYIPAHIHLGNALLKSTKFNEAEIAFREAIKNDSRNAYALLGLARLRIQQGNWKDAKTILKVTVEASQHQIGVDLLATAYQELGEQEAADHLKRKYGFGAYRDLADPWMDEILSDCYDPYRMATTAGMAAFRGNQKSAIALLERAIQIAPRGAMLHFQLGGVLESTGNMIQALKRYQRSIQLKPDFSDGWFSIYQIHKKTGNAILAQRTLEQGFQNCPDSPALLIEMADYMRREGRFSDAVNLLQKSINLRPNEAQAYLNLARLYLQSNQVALGVAAMEDALKVEPAHPMALTTLAINAIDTKNQTQADSLLNRIYDQPRIDAQTIAKITERYQTQFGKAP